MNPEIIPRYSTTHAAEAACVLADRLQAWLDRGAFKLAATDTNTTGHGVRREWSLRTIYRLSVMAAITRHGVSLSRANAAATACIAKCEFISEYERTVAVVEMSGAVKVLPLNRAQSFEDLFDNHIGTGDSLLVIDLTRLFARVSDKLKLFERDI